MNNPHEPSELSKALLAAVEADPSNWQARKSAAVKLFEDNCFLEAADVIWNTPEIPSTDMDVAFAVKIVSRARPNRSIRLVYEVLRRNSGKSEQNMAMARAFNLIGLPMLASRFYGAALATAPENFDIGFEHQSLWCDDSGAILDAWEKNSLDIKKPFSKELAEFVGDPIKCADLNEEKVKQSQVTAPVGVSKPNGLIGAPMLRASVPSAPMAKAGPPTAPPAATPVRKGPSVPKPSPMRAPASETSDS